MVILGIDSTNADCGSCAVTRDGAVTASEIISGQVSETLMPAAARIIESAGGISMIDRIAVAVGPGSFTGIRVGVALVKGLAYGRGDMVVPVSSLEVLAKFSLCHNEGGGISKTAAVIDARGGRCWYALFENGVRVTEDTAGRYEDIPKDYMKIEPNGTFLLAESVCGIAQNRAAVSADAVIPAYLSLSQAEREKGNNNGYNQTQNT